MQVKNLKNTDFKTIINCFNTSFSDYSVALPTEKSFWEERWQHAKVDYELSFGMFDNDKLIGFIINAIDVRNTQLTAYNTGTGVIPEYRGKKIIQSIYKYAIPVLLEKGIVRCTLEVIKTNYRAVNLYQNIGFSITKNYKCYKGKILNDDKVDILEVEINKVDWKNLPNQTLYSWDFHENVIKSANYKFYQVLNNRIVASYFIINPTNGTIAQFEFLDDFQNFNRLFSGVKSIIETIKINNVDEKLTHKIDYLNSIGLEDTVNQYEMEMVIKDI